MDSGFGSNQVSDDDVKKMYKMSLLLIQTKELLRMYNGRDIESSRKQYYVVDKNWLDQFKTKNDYNKAIEEYNHDEDWEYYINFKRKISQKYNVDLSDMTCLNPDELINSVFDFKSGRLEKIDISYPQNVELVKKEYIDDCIGGEFGFPLYEVVIGRQTIVIKEESKDRCLFCCSLVERHDNNINFEIKVEYIMVFEDNNILFNEIDEITNSGLDSYLSAKNIDVNSNKEQNISNSSMNNI